MKASWRIGIYGDPYGGDDELKRVGEQVFETRGEAKMVVDHLEQLERHSEYDFKVYEGRGNVPIQSACSLCL